MTFDYNVCMSSGESLISIILLFIAYMLYQIAKQLSYLTGRKIKFTLPKWGHTPMIPKSIKKKEKEKNLPN